MRSTPTPSFDIQRKLGSGGMADVHLAKMALAGETGWVALKRIRADARHDPELVTLFRREAKLCSLLQHPNIVPVRTWGVDDQGCFLALEYIDGPSASRLLKALSRSGRQLPLDAALWMLRDVAAALEYAHAFEFPALGIRGVVHRDVSADNVLVSRDGVTTLTDFGIAKLLGGTRLTRTGTVKGKYGYMAPELFRGEESTAAVDVFAFCVLGYELLTGVRPFPGASEAEVLHAVLHAQPPALASLRPDVPGPLAALLREGLAKDPSHRPGQMRVFREALERLLLDAAPRRVLAALTHEFAAATEGEAPVTEAAASRPLTLTHAAAEPAQAAGGGRRVLMGGALAALLALGGAAFVWLNPKERVEAGPVEEVFEASSVPEVPAEPEVAEPAPPPPAPAARTRRPRPAQKVAVPAAPVREPPVEPAAKTGAAALGSLRILQVFVDGKLVGITPLPVLSLPAGRRSLILVNEALDVREVHHVEVRAGEQQDVKYTLRGR